MLAEVPHVRKDAGYPPLVTPSSQIVGTQAVFNVMMGRYKVLTGEFADLMLGYYGSTIGRATRRSSNWPRKQAKKEPITCRPADLLKPEWDELRAQALALTGCNGTDEDVLTYAMFPQVAPKFFAHRHEGPQEPRQGVRGKPAKPGAPAAPARRPPRRPTTARGRCGRTITYDVKLGRPDAQGHGRRRPVGVDPATSGPSCTNRELRTAIGRDDDKASRRRRCSRWRSG